MKASSESWFSKLRTWLKSGRQGPKPVTYFVHIPKTAGTSFIVLLDRFFAVDHIFPHQLWREVGDIDTEANAHFELFRGHFGGGGVAQLTDRPIEFLTILRDPRTLARSTYQYVLREPNTKVHELVSQQAMDMAEFLQHPMTAPLVKNRLIRNLSFDFVADPAAQEVFLSAQTIEYLQPIIQQQQAAIDDHQRLQRAQKLVRDCRWFGLLERFDESLQLLSYAMCWPPFGATQKLNAHRQSVPFTAAETDQLERLNHEDLRLYEQANAWFEHRLQSMHADLEQHRKTLEQDTDALLDLHYQHHHAQLVAAQMPNAMHYGFDQVLLGSQWHRRECMQPEQEWFRWTGPGALATIDFWLQPGAYQVRMRLINATSEERLDQLKLSLNGEVVSWHTTDAGVVRVLTLTCTAEHFQPNGLLRLGIECSNMISHQAAFDSDDERLVGVAVHWIKFNHVN
ncbi:hypothetical protein [Marinicella meishanensis]|uniref:hypothetical protein n=1 Tax=Marinicella meishanensis TaxID=2873263 RepID=UPI001CBF221C|nr:hypothetical protein [Marinicella sp. NBU2979]